MVSDADAIRGGFQEPTGKDMATFDLEPVSCSKAIYCCGGQRVSCIHKICSRAFAQ